MLPKRNNVNQALCLLNYVSFVFTHYWVRKILQSAMTPGRASSLKIQGIQSTSRYFLIFQILFVVTHFEKESAARNYSLWLNELMEVMEHYWKAIQVLDTFSKLFIIVPERNINKLRKDRRPMEIFLIPSLYRYAGDNIWEWHLCLLFTMVRRNYEMAIKFIRLSGSLKVAFSSILQSLAIMSFLQ